MHKRKEIISNQLQFKEEITKFLRAEYSDLKKEIKGIKSKDPDIVAGKNSLISKSKKLNINEQINKLFISYKNIRPEYYAWWDEIGEQVLKLKYTDK